MFDACLAVALLVCFLLGLYCMVDTAIVFDRASDESLLQFKPGAQAQAAEAGDIGNIAWITLDGTNIDYPVMQGKDNKEYLNKDPYGDYSLSGSIFLDSANAADFGDSYNLVYGHHMEAGKMFGQLDSFLQRDFFSEHRTGSLETKDGTYYRLDVFAAVETTAENVTVFDVKGSSAEDVTSMLQRAAEQGRLASADEGEGAAGSAGSDAAGSGEAASGTPGSIRGGLYREPAGAGGERKVVALSTCESTDTTERIVVFCTMTQAEKPAADEAQGISQDAVQRGDSVVPWLVLAAAIALVVALLVYRRRRPREAVGGPRADGAAAQVDAQADADGNPRETRERR